MEGAGLDEGGLGDAAADALAHLVGRPPREGQGEYAVGSDTPLAHQVGDARHEHPGLARAWSREHQQGAARVLDGPLLVGVEVRGRRYHSPFP